MIQNSLWLYTLIILSLNLLPIGNSGTVCSRSLNRTSILQLRLDYWVHSVMMLGFAWIWVLGKIVGVKWFDKHEAVKLSAIIGAIGLALEFVQFFLPWRNYNPIDLVFNVLGAGISVCIVFCISRRLDEN